MVGLHNIDVPTTQKGAKPDGSYDRTWPVDRTNGNLKHLYSIGTQTIRQPSRPQVKGDDRGVNPPNPQPGYQVQQMRLCTPSSTKKINQKSDPEWRLPGRQDFGSTAPPRWYMFAQDLAHPAT